MTAAIEAAEIGFLVILIEKEACLGGQAIGMNRYFPKMCPPYCGMEINFKRIKQNPLITVLTQTQLIGFSPLVEGGQGGIGGTATLQTAAELVTDECTRCGKCVDVCPVERPDRFNLSMISGRCIYHSHDLSFPERFTIDEELCLKEKCHKCQDICEYHAIDLAAKPHHLEVEVQSILLATGWSSYDPSKLTDFCFGQHPDILTNLMMERLQAPNGPTLGKIICQNSEKIPQLISFVQCAGSRDQKHLPYCSGVCCSASLKQALHAVEMLPDVRVNIHYIDLRVSGRNEDFLKKVEDHPRINLIKGKVAKIEIKNGKPKLTWENIGSNRKETQQTDLVVLATGMVPNPAPVANLLAGERSYLDPVNLPKGVVLAGSAIQPMDIVASVRSGTGWIGRLGD